MPASNATDLREYRKLPALRSACRYLKVQALRYWRQQARDAHSPLARAHAYARLSRERAKKPHQFRTYALSEAQRYISQTGPATIAEHAARNGREFRR